MCVCVCVFIHIQVLISLAKWLMMESNSVIIYIGLGPKQDFIINCVSVSVHTFFRSIYIRVFVCMGLCECACVCVRVCVSVCLCIRASIC